MTTRPIWLHPQLYQKVCELQLLCNRLQYTGTIIVDPNNVTIMQDDSHTCTIPADHARNITTFVDPMAAIKDDLVHHRKYTEDTRKLPDVQTITGFMP
ncbi:hypothetical protein C2G38_2201564 [Gigaspora rosea]|uniref:Uncharacterized protein n=1 Tax=Gigaspora rosea TaxID=44941 RepID=A0A397US78_9GLOM|nr:hypothetical protein C2G38_2201564 [Gigaspora rosea]